MSDRRILTCDQCKRDTPIWWTDDQLWDRVMGGPEGGILCPICFAMQADPDGRHRRTFFIADRYSPGCVEEDEETGELKRVALSRLERMYVSFFFHLNRIAIAALVLASLLIQGLYGMMPWLLVYAAIWIAVVEYRRRRSL